MVQSYYELSHIPDSQSSCKNTKPADFIKVAYSFNTRYKLQLPNTNKQPQFFLHNYRKRLLTDSWALLSHVKERKKTEKVCHFVEISAHKHHHAFTVRILGNKLHSSSLSFGKSEELGKLGISRTCQLRTCWVLSASTMAINCQTQQNKQPPHPC